MYDLVIRGGTIADGSGGPLKEGDVAVQNGRIVAVGKLGGQGREEIDARGLLVTPGFVDVHTHYDAQVTWDQAVTPSSWHGITTVVMGNCGVGFAPARPDRHDWLIELMEGVEDIPGTALHEGITWGWESFAEYMNIVAAKPHAIDIGAQMPHGALRAYVMGERGAAREPASAEDIAEMARLTQAAIEAGALGFSTSRTIQHRSRTGAPIPTLGAAREELLGIARGLKAAGRGVVQMISDFDDIDFEFGLMREIARESGRPLSFSLMQNDLRPGLWRQLLGLIEQATAEGIPIRAQVATRPVGVLMGLQITMNPFVRYPSYTAIADKPLAERVAIMRDPAFKARLLAETPGNLPPLESHITRSFDRLFPLGDPPDYEPTPEMSVAAIAARQGCQPIEVAYDLLLERDGRELLYFPVMNYTDFNLDAVREMLLHPATRFGLGDGGAHCGLICDGTFSTTMMTLWARDRSRGERLPLETAVQALTSDPAALIGLHDRGQIKPGMKADLNVIDFDRLTLHAPEVVWDLPAGGRRLIQRAEGYRATIVSGETILRDDTLTGALPGRLVRSGQAEPKAQAAE